MALFTILKEIEHFHSGQGGFQTLVAQIFRVRHGKPLIELKKNHKCFLRPTGNGVQQASVIIFH